MAYCAARAACRPSARAMSSSSPPAAPGASPTADLTATERDIADLQARTRDALAAGQLATALEAAEDALAASRAYYGAAHAAVAAALNNVALVRKSRGEVDAAIAAYEDALRMYETLAGRESPSAATASANLGLAHVAAAARARGVDKLGHVDAARELLQTALDVRRRTLGPRHAMVGVSL